MGNTAMMSFFNVRKDKTLPDCDLEYMPYEKKYIYKVTLSNGTIIRIYETPHNIEKEALRIATTYSSFYNTVHSIEEIIEE